ncbi:MAG TPA: sporulation protein YabP [Lachnospiraceae bacterium]|nr:sporulation protein YabP [Lachnospiraceae bacterium]HPF29829.1 sporulation protein YabP [Lachnospiraceae bacterium]
MEDLTGTSKKNHKIIIGNRQTTNISGVLDVCSFDELVIVLDTERGMLTIRGNELHVNRLTLEKGEVDIEGRIDSLSYSDGSGGKNSKESVFERIFR